MFSASDLRPALVELTSLYKAHANDSVVYVFGSTTSLAMQIAQGAPADVFLAANVEAIDTLEARGMTVQQTRRRYAVGSIAMAMLCSRTARGNESCVPPQSVQSIRDLASPQIRSIAIADPRYAPYGMAARQALERAGIWKAIEPRIVVAPNVLQAWQYMTTGNVDVSIVALSLVIQDSAHAYVTVDSALYDRPQHELALIASSHRKAAGERFITFLFSDTAKKVMQRYGFTTPADIP